MNPEPLSKQISNWWNSKPNAPKSKAHDLKQSDEDLMSSATGQKVHWLVPYFVRNQTNVINHDVNFVLTQQAWAVLTKPEVREIYDYESGFAEQT